MWTLVTYGLVVLPSVGLVAVIADLVDAWRDKVLIEAAAAYDKVAVTQATHNVRTQIASAVALAAIAAMAIFALTGILDRTLMAILIYTIAGVLVADAWRSRRARKRLIRLLESAGG